MAAVRSAILIAATSLLLAACTAPSVPADRPAQPVKQIPGDAPATNTPSGRPAPTN